MAQLVIQWLVAVICAWAFILQLAAWRDPSIVDTKKSGAARKIAMVAMLVSAIYIAHLSRLDQAVDKPILLVLAMLALSNINFAFHRLFPEHDND